MFFNRQILVIFTLCFLQLSHATAATTDWHKSNSDAAQTRLIASFYEENGSKKLIAGVQFKINDGWKIYGQGSESIGMPPSFDFNGSTNVSDHKLYWPQPEIHEEKIGKESFKYSAYHNEVIIPINVDLQDLTSPTELTLTLDYGLCKDICIPVSEKFSLKISSDEIDRDTLKEIEKFYPQKITNELSPRQEKPAQSYALLLYIFFAILGGLILNVMPCVLPVLSIKLLSIIDRPNAKISRIRFAFFSTTVGIVSCFVIFAALACFIKFSGNELGWGLQFQNPSFLIFLIILTTIFTANLLGKFEISFEQVLATFLNKKISENEKKKNVFVPNFLSGVLATLLATPCSAPFLGSAITFALTQDFTTIFTIFFFIGIGFASPYIILFFTPELVRSLPKPGNWMITLKQTLALFLVATLLWLVYVLASSLDTKAIILILLLSTGIFFSFKIPNQLIRLATIILLAGSAFSLPSEFQRHHIVDKNMEEPGARLWHRFDENEINRLVAEGRVVVVDITADWCITCKFNKVHVLQSKEIVALLKVGEIIGMRGDITKPDPEIMEYMRRHNRFAIPFNAVYGPGAKDGLLTSELLTKSELLKLIEQAR